MTHAGSRAACLVILACAAVVVASMRMRWGYGGVGVDQTAFTLTQLPAAVLAVGLVVAAVAAGAIAALLGRPAGLAVAAAAGAVLTGGIAVFVLALETADAVVPPFAVLLAAHGWQIGAGAGSGAWLALAAASIAATAAWAPARDGARSIAAQVRSRGAAVVLATSALAGALAALIELRQMPWIGTPRTADALQPEELFATWGGTATAVAGWLLAWAILLACQGEWQQGALTAATAGWLTNATAATVIATARAFADPGAGARLAAWLLFFLGLAIAAAAAVVLRREAPAR